MTGGTNADVFVLGNETLAFYDDGARNRLEWKDFALVSDFGTGRDVIQLHESSDGYRLRNATGLLPRGTVIYLKTEGRNELIGIVADDTNLDLNSNAFTFV